jgi:hypothetical protein
MKAHTCYHCKQWVEEGEAHDCWTTTEDALTRDLPDDLREAWERLRETLGELGEQRIYASHNSIMFSRRACYAFVRPSAKRLELYFFLGRTVRSPVVKKAQASSRVKVAHQVHLLHRDQVEPPLTDWLREAYEVSDELSARRSAPTAKAKTRPAPAAKAKRKAESKAASKSKATARKSVRAKAKTRPPAPPPGRPRRPRAR